MLTRNFTGLILMVIAERLIQCEHIQIHVANFCTMLSHFYVYTYHFVTRQYLYVQRLSLERFIIETMNVTLYGNNALSC